MVALMRKRISNLPETAAAHTRKIREETIPIVARVASPTTRRALFAITSGGSQATGMYSRVSEERREPPYIAF